MMSSKCPLLLVGSQTGNAADVADKVWRSALLSGIPSLLDVHVRTMDDWLSQSGSLLPLPSVPIILIASTTGQGDPPDNMRRFWRALMRRSLPNDSCSQVRAAVFGLGDSSYPKYNFVGKKLFRRLQILGARMLLPLGLGDDQHALGLDGALSPWLDQLLAALAAEAGEEMAPRVDAEFPRKFCVSEVVGETEKEAGLFPPHALPFVVVGNERVTSEDHFQDTRLISFAPPSSFPLLPPGSVVCVLPSNCSADVTAFLSILSIPATALLHARAAHPACHPQTTPPPASLAALAEKYFDLNAVPRKVFFEMLHAFSRDEDEKERLGELVAPENIDDLLQYAVRPRRSVLETLGDFPKTTAGLSAQEVFELMPRIRERQFSVASYQRERLELLVAVVDFKAALLRRRRKGLCSSFLRDCNVGDVVPVWAAEVAGLKFPEEGSVVMVGPGTGVAPFRARMQERRKRGGRDVLVFGCRYKEKDFYFQDEWRKLEEEEKLHLITAFSRNHLNDAGGRMYVQDRLRQAGALVWRTLADGASFFVAGNAKEMPDAVRQALVSVAEQEGGMTKAQAEAWVATMERSGRYQAETWS